MVGEQSVRLRQLILGHVAGDAIADCHFTHGPGFVWPGRLQTECVTREAFGVICGWFLNERLMRIVASDAGKPGVAVGAPTAALLKAIRLKADQPGTGLAAPSTTSAHAV